MIIEPGRQNNNNSGLLFKEDFRTHQLIQSRGGALVGCSVGNGISPTAASSRVTFAGTENVGINATQMTIVLRFRTGAANIVTSRRFLIKNPAAFNDQQFYVQLDAGGAGLAGRILFSVAASVADTANFAYANNSFALSTEYHFGIVYNGGLAAASRAAFYVNGSSQALTISGTIPAAMRANSQPVTIYNANGEALYAPPTDFILRSARIYNTAWSAEEVLDDYQNDTYAELYGGG